MMRALAIGVALLAAAGCRNSDGAPDAGEGGEAALTLEPTDHDFEALFPGGAAGPPTSFVVTNAGTAASGSLTVELGGRDAAEFFIAGDDCASTTLAPASSCIVAVRFAPATAGAKIATLIVSGAPGGRVIATLVGTGSAVATLAVAAPSSVFGDVIVGETSERDFIVSNLGGTPTGPLAIGISGLGGAAFTRIAAASDDCPSGPLAAGEGCTVRVRFAPTSRAAKSAQLEVSATPGGAVSAALSGSGIAPAALRSGLGTTSTFANQPLATASPSLDWVIANLGDATSAAPVVVKSGVDQADFSHTTTCTAPLSGGTSCTVSIVFTPSAHGARSATFTVTAGAQVLALDVRGNGVTRVTVKVVGTGSVSSADNLVSGCTAISGRCSADYGSATLTALTATTANGSYGYFQDWSSPSCDGPAKACAESTAANVTVTATFGSYATSGNLMFATSTNTWNGSSGSVVSTYDAECNRVASAAGINDQDAPDGSLYIAWISTASSNARSRLGSGFRGWVRLDGAILADDQASWLSATSPRFLNPVRYDENGTVLTLAAGTVLVTGTGPDGNHASSCTSFTGAGTLTVGDAQTGAIGYTFANTINCASPGRLLCVMKRNTVALSVPAPPAGSKQIALTNTLHTPGATTPNQHCAAEAGAGWVALIGSVGSTWGPLLDDATVYRRPDGVVVGTGARLKAIGAAPMSSAFFQRANGTYLETSFGGPASTWVGPVNSTTVGTDVNTCQGWTNPAFTPPGAYVGTVLSATAYMFANGYSSFCNVGRWLYCIEP